MLRVPIDDYLSCVEVLIFVSLPKNYSSMIIPDFVRRVFGVYEFTHVESWIKSYKVHRQINTYKFSLNKFVILCTAKICVSNSFEMDWQYV